MPYKPNKPCRHPGCAALVPADEKYCIKHRPLYARPATGRGYNGQWQKTYLREHPLCAECLKQGRYTQATVVDHIRPHRGDKALFWDKSNWQSLCKPCHDRKTGRFDSKPTYGY